MRQFLTFLAWIPIAATALAQPFPDPVLPPFPALEVDARPIGPIDSNSPYASPRDEARHRLSATLDKFRTDKNVPAAIRGIEQALAADPAYPTAAFDLGVICAMAGKWDDSAWAFGEAVRLNASLNAAITPELERVRLIASLEKTPDGANGRRFDEALARLLVTLPSQSSAEAVKSLADLAKSDLKRWEAPALIAGRVGDSGDYSTAAGFLGIAIQRNTSPEARPKLDAALAATQREVDYGKSLASAIAFRQEKNWKKCAEMYEAAWKVFPARTDNGMEAATAWLLADDTADAVAVLNRLRATASLTEKAVAMIKALAPVEPTAGTALQKPVTTEPPGSPDPVKISTLLPDVTTKEMPILIREPLKLMADTLPVRTYDSLAVDPLISTKAAAEGLPLLPAPSVAGEAPQRELAAYRQQAPAAASDQTMQTVSRATAGKVAREIHVATVPAGAQVTIGEDSQPICRTPCTVQTSAFSENLRVEAHGYYPATQVAKFAARADSTDVSLVLEPIRGHVLIEQSGTLLVNGKPVDAVIPGEISLMPGLYEFEIRQQGRSVKAALGVRADSRVRLPLDPPGTN